MKTATAKNLTDNEISTLRAEAISAGDYARSAICDLAIAGRISMDDYTCLDREDERRIASMDQSAALEIVADAINSAGAIHYTVIDRDNGERYSTTSSPSRELTERERNRLALTDGKIVSLGIGQINPDGTIDDVTEVRA